MAQRKDCEIVAINTRQLALLLVYVQGQNDISQKGQNDISPKEKEDMLEEVRAWVKEDGRTLPDSILHIFYSATGDSEFFAKLFACLDVDFKKEVV